MPNPSTIAREEEMEVNYGRIPTKWEAAGPQTEKIKRSVSYNDLFILREEVNLLHGKIWGIDAKLDLLMKRLA